ncbi:MAG TPA: RNA polymerase sigma factor [Acidimicrobiales bacterium]|nr:RNA polymerase sigma factor [Acidimicrobiales bacterium]
MDEAGFQSTLQGAASGDRRALTALYARYNRVLVRYLRVHAPGYGEDLAHETWLSVTPALRQFTGSERAFRMMLLAEARRQAVEFKRASGQGRVKPVAPSCFTGLRATSVGDEPVADAALAELLAGLRPLHAEILLLRVVGGLSAEETGALLGKSPGMIRVTQHRVLKQLARRLGNDRVAQ